MKKGLFFGSFNPIHMGHLAIAQHMLNEAGLEQVVFIVSPHNPFKDETGLIPAQKRLDMVRLSIGDNPRLAVSDIEFGLEKPSYTYRTLRELKKQYPNDEFTLLMGSDTLEQLPEWKHSEEILAYPVLVYRRPGASINPYAGVSSVKILETPMLDISASAIRQMLDSGKEVKYLVRDEIINLLKIS